MDELFPGVQRIDQQLLPDEDATLRFARTVSSSASAGDFFGLIGDLGAGKTTFAKGFVAARGGGLEATSPTYTLVNVYESEPPIFHFDLWRLEDVDGLESVGYWDYLDDSGICLVEWLDRVPEAWPGHGTIVELQKVKSYRIATLWRAPEK